MYLWLIVSFSFHWNINFSFAKLKPFVLNSLNTHTTLNGEQPPNDLKDHLLDEFSQLEKTDKSKKIVNETVKKTGGVSFIKKKIKNNSLDRNK